MGPPIAYEIDGKQYVSLMGGSGTFKPPIGTNFGPGPNPSSPKLLTFVLDGTAALPDCP